MSEYRLAAIFLSLLIVLACEDRSNLTEPELIDHGEADFSKYLSIGNSLTAGMQNGALYQSGQKYSFTKLIANQAEVEFIQPTIDDPGMGGRIEIKSLNPFETTYQPLAAGFPNNSDYDSTFNNLGIPGSKLSDLLYSENSVTSSDPSNLFFDIVLRERGTVIQQVINYKPTLLTLWIGNNDILGYATSGGILSYTKVDSFALLFDELCKTLSQNEIKVILANIPNISAIPFFTTVGPAIGNTLTELNIEDPQITGIFYETSESQNIAEAKIDELINNQILVTLSGSSAGKYLGNTEGDYYTESNTPIPSNVNISAPFGLNPENPFPNKFILDHSEQIIIENVTSSFNAAISNNAQKYGFYLVDMNAFFNQIETNGFWADGIYFTTEYIFGGLFSLDGIHPTNQGYGIIANKFIEVINDKFNSDLPYINISTLPGSIPINYSQYKKSVTETFFY